MDYSSTINLPRTDFSMKAGLSEREPVFVREWEKQGLYQKIREKRAGREKFILHDGPPYANGHIHLGHALNKILKDIIVKYNTMAGRDSSFVPGWDCHGLPIELMVVKALKGERAEKSDLRKKCREYAGQFIEIQKEEFKRLGILADWDNPYLTMSEDYEKAIVDAFAALVEKGYVYRALKPVYWCSSCETALADAEVEYQEHHTPSLYVKFQIKPNKIFSEKAYWLIWTTTPWTLPGNTAVCLNPDEDYAAVKVPSGEWWLFAGKRLSELKERLKFEPLETRKLNGKDLEGLTAEHPFLKRDSRVVFDRYVTMDTGTGCVHIAPGHGYEDYIIGLNYKLPVLSPVDNKGRFTEEAGISEWTGENVFKANDKIIERLKSTGHLLLTEKLVHSYPHCWRCRKPVIFRATFQWFLSVEHEHLREKCLEAIGKVRWVPEWGIDRIGNMMKERPDWCLSRQRAWGVPIPAFYCEECGETVLTPQTIRFFSGLVEKNGVDIWFTLPADKLLPEGFKCPKCKKDRFKKEEDILDVWFDSGVSHTAVLENPRWKNLSFPADMYLEGSDQHRGWFQTSLIPAVALKGSPPYRQVLTHGFTLDEKGAAMHKSTGNVIEPQAIYKKYGADILRLWVSSIDYRDDVRIGEEILKRLVESYRKIRNTFRYILGNINGFRMENDPDNPLTGLDEFDLWALAKLKKFDHAIRKAYENYEFHLLYHHTVNFCSVTLSNLYFDVLKDRLYVEKADSARGRSSRTVLTLIFKTLVKLLAPVLSFTAEDAWKVFCAQEGGKEGSVHLEEFEKLSPDDGVLKGPEEKWDRIFQVREEVNKALEKAKTDKMIGHTLEACLVIKPLKENMRSFLLENRDLLPFAFIVSRVKIADELSSAVFSENSEMKISVLRAEGEKCGRCWNYSASAGEDPEHGSLCGRCRTILGL